MGKVAATNLPKAPVPDAVASEPEPSSYVAPAPVPYVASVPALAPYVAPAPDVEDHDDIEVISGEQESVANTVPLALSPAYYYAPQQGYYHQPPVTPAVVQAPVQTPVAYYAPYHGYQPATASVPVTYQTAPVAAAVPVSAPVPGQATQFHAQSELGEYNYGYANVNSAKQEFKTADGIVQGTYSYVDGNGIVQTVNYIADDHGFRVAATNLPQAPVAAPVEPIVADVVPEVKALDAIDLRTEDFPATAA